MTMLPLSIDWGPQLPAWLPAMAPAWPLLLVVGLALPRLHGTILRLAPWAAVPALLVAIAAPPSVQPLPGLMLGASLMLDDAGRWVLAAVALLWLAAGLLATRWLCSPRRAAAFLLATAGALWLPVAGDLPTMLAASALAAYPLYGLLRGGRGGRVLLVSVVIADLLILEALLTLAKGAAGLDFTSLRRALAAGHAGTVPMVLLLAGFGAKAGAMGLHYWLAPALAGAGARQVGPVVAFTLAAGLLPGLRLLPLGDVQWPAAAELLPWLALAGGGWAVAAGLLQRVSRAVIAYALSALTMLWLGLAGLALGRPAVAAGLSEVLPAALASAGLGLGALLVVAAMPVGGGRGGRALLAPLSVLLIAAAVLAAALPAGAAGGGLQGPIIGSIACVGLLLGASAVAVGSGDPDGSEPGMPAAAALVTGGFVMAGLAVAALPAMPPPVGAWSGDGVIASAAALLGGLAGGLVSCPALARLPRVPPGDLLVAITLAAAGLGGAWQRLGQALGRWRDRLYDAITSVRRAIRWQDAAGAVEGRLRRWSTATLLLLAAGAALAFLARLA